MSRAQSAAQVIVYIESQIVADEAILARHLPHHSDLCSCGRAAPCPIAQTAGARRDHFVAKLDLLRARLHRPEPARQLVVAPAIGALAWIAQSLRPGLLAAISSEQV